MRKILLMLSCIFAATSLHAADDTPKPLNKVTFLLNLLPKDDSAQAPIDGLGSRAITCAGTAAAQKSIKQGKLVGTVQSLLRQVTYSVGKIDYNDADNRGLPRQPFRDGLALPDEIIVANAKYTKKYT